VSQPELRTFGQRVRALRVERGMTQEQLAYRAGIDRSYLGGVERGERNVALVNLCLIAKGLGVSLAELFDELGEILEGEG
jgi:transcriptional regulator with XRE-family HTH domain